MISLLKTRTILSFFLALGVLVALLPLLAGGNEFKIRERGGELPNCARPPFPGFLKKERYTTTKRTRWKSGQTIRVYFQNGTSQERGMVEHYAREWERFGNFRLDFRSERKTQKDHAIVIKFEKQPPGVAGSSSVGGGTTSTKYRSLSLHRGRQSSRTVIHEFGHSLGFYHEQDNPKIRSSWKREEAIRYFMKRYKRTREQIEKWLFSPARDKYKNFGYLDPESVMAYYFSGKLFRNGRSFGGGRWVSEGDSKGIARLYPGRKQPHYSGGTELFFHRKETFVNLSVTNGEFKLYVNRKFMGTLRDEGRTRYGKNKKIDIGAIAHKGRTRIDYVFKPLAADFKGYVSVRGKHPTTGKDSYITSSGCSSKYGCNLTGGEKRGSFYITHYDRRNRGQANYYREPNSKPVVNPVVDPVKKKYNEKLNHALLLASYDGLTGNVRDLLRRRANPNGRNKGWTSLMYAAYFGHEAVARLLLGAGANVNLKYQGWRALDLARARKHGNIVRLLESRTRRARFRKRGRAPRRLPRP